MKTRPSIFTKRIPTIICPIKDRMVEVRPVSTLEVPTFYTLTDDRSFPKKSPTMYCNCSLFPQINLATSCRWVSEIAVMVSHCRVCIQCYFPPFHISYITSRYCYQWYRQLRQGLTCDSWSACSLPSFRAQRLHLLAKKKNWKKGELLERNRYSTISWNLNELY